MSRTRALVAELRDRLGHGAPLAPAEAPHRIEPAPRPVRIVPAERKRSRFGERARKHTTALVGIGNVGTRYATEVALQFQAELAVAHEAVAGELDESWAADNGLLWLRSRVSEHREFLLRPDLGRRLAEESALALRTDAKHDIDVQPILADGLSASACVRSGMEVLGHLTEECEKRGYSVGTPMCAKFSRVWLEDEIGERVGARAAVIILGERPGLGTGDGLSAYMVFRPEIGKLDSDRNMISNIHSRGILPKLAARRIARFFEQMFAQDKSGVSLDLSALGAEDAGMHREPQVRKQLVEVGR